MDCFGHTASGKTQAPENVRSLVSVKPALLATNATLLGGSTNISATETYSVADMEDEASAANVGRTPS